MVLCGGMDQVEIHSLSSWA